MEKRGIMERNSGYRSGEFPYSREWADIDCSAVSCVNNRNKKCVIPSYAIIDDNGKCTGFKSVYIKNK